MRPSIRRWLDWVMTDVLTLNRHRPRGPAIHVRYEKAGRSVDGRPVPWNADAVIVEVTVRLPVAARQRAQFALRLPGFDTIPAESLRCESGDRHRLTFQVPVPVSTALGELLWKHHVLSRVEIPMLTASEFLLGLNASLPAVYMKLGSQSVAARSFVASQCKGLTATIVLRSPTPLAPLTELGLTVAFRSERTGAEHLVPVVLTSSQLAGNEAAISVSLPRVKKYGGTWAVSWQAGGRELARQLVHGITAKRFERSLRVADSRFFLADKIGHVKLVKRLPPGNRGPFGPCFLLASGEPGVAGFCKVIVHATGQSETLPADAELDVLVTDGPTLVAPGLLHESKLCGANGFELRLKGRVLGFASLSPVPSAPLTAEGGFKTPPDFLWSSVADEELQERLNRLMNGG